MDPAVRRWARALAAALTDDPAPAGLSLPAPDPTLDDAVYAALERVTADEAAVFAALAAADEPDLVADGRPWPTSVDLDSLPSDR